MKKTIQSTENQHLTHHRTRYSERIRYVKVFTKPSMTKQNHKAECDIHNILKRFNETGQLPDMIRENPQYGDFSNVKDYQESLEIVIKAEEQFAALPAKVRDRFNNNPAMFLEFATNPENGRELVKLGLATENKEYSIVKEQTKVQEKPADKDKPKEA